MFSNKCFKLVPIFTSNSRKILLQNEPSHINLGNKQAVITWRPFALSRNSQNKDELEIFGNLRHRIPTLLDRNSIDDIETKNAFKLFNLRPRYNISMAKLHSEMKNLQRVLHPDKFVDESDKVQNLSNDVSAMVNDYYRILKDPYERAKYLLALISKKSHNSMEENLEKLEMDSEFLTRMMDIRSQIADSSTEQLELQKIHSILESDLENSIIEINKLFEAKDIKGVIERLGMLKFLSNCHKAAEDRLGISVDYSL